MNDRMVNILMILCFMLGLNLGMILMKATHMPRSFVERATELCSPSGGLEKIIAPRPWRSGRAICNTGVEILIPMEK